MKYSKKRQDDEKPDIKIINRPRAVFLQVKAGVEKKDCVFRRLIY